MYGGRVAESFQPPFGSREERMAYNEAWCRGINERKAEWMKGGDLVGGFRCECWQVNCADRIRLSGREWQEGGSGTDSLGGAAGTGAAGLQGGGGGERVNCADRIRRSGREWQEVRSRPNGVAVAPGHVAAELEAVIEEYPHFW